MKCVLLHALLFAIAVHVGSAESARADDAAFVDPYTERFFDGLRERRLFSLAEGHCLRELARDDLPRDERATLLIELSRTFVDHARYVEGTERDDLWDRALAVLDDFAQEGRERPRDAAWLSVSTQRGLLAAAISESLRRRVEVTPHDRALRRKAVERLDAAIPEMVRLDETLADVSRVSIAGIGRPVDAPPASLVRQLRFNVQFRLVAARLDRAALAERTSPERADQLNLASELAKSLAGGDPREESTRSAHVLLARVERLRGDFDDALALLDRLLEETADDESHPLSRDVRDDVEAERARNHVARGRPDAAAESLQTYAAERGSLPGELRFEMAQALVAMWQLAAERDAEEVAASAMQRLEAHVRAIEVEVGGYWGYRSRLLLDFAQSSGRVGPELAAILRDADGRYRAGEVAEAIDGYARAVEIALRDGRDEVAEELAFTRASLELQADRFESAATHFAALAERFPESARAPRADLLAAYALGRVYDADRTAEHRDVYTAALERHRERYPREQTFGDASFLLGRLHAQRLQYTDALRALLDVPLDHSRGFDAAAEVVRMYEAILARLQELGRSTDAWEASARERIAARVEGLPRAPVPLTPSHAEFATRAARFHSRRDPPEFTLAERLLEHVAASASSALVDGALPAEARARWESLRQRAVQLRIVTLAGTDRTDAARELVARLADEKPEVLLDVLDGLTRVAAESGATLERSLGYLQLETAKQLLPRREELSPSARRRLDLCLAQAYAATANVDRAIETYERLLEETPRDEALLQTVAELLAACGRPGCVQRAQRIWQRLERLRKPGTAAWFDARFRVIEALSERGRHEEARKLLNVTRVLYPDLGGQQSRERFGKLDRSLDGT